MAGKPKETGEYLVSREMLSVQLVADELGVSDQAVRDWIRQGDLPAYRFSGPLGYRIKRPDLDRFLLSRKVAARVMAGSSSGSR